METRRKTWLFGLALGLLAACSPGPPGMTAEAAFTYLALGDSYTIGQSVAEGDRFPVQLVARLREDGLTVAEPEIVAQTGWTTRDPIGALSASPKQDSYDLVTLLVGVNDQFRGYALERYEADFANMLARAIELAGGDSSRVVVLSIPDWGVTPAGASYDPQRIAAEIDAFNAINRRLSEAAGIAYVDITPVSRQADNHFRLIAGDGLHPSAEMYALWVDELYDVVLNALGEAG
jgi:lysophospholipase L1-like esterase